MAVTMACKLIRAGEPYVAGARGLCMTVLPLPDGARAKAHLHRGIETAAYIMEGEVDMYYGERLEHFLQARAGEYVYVPADMPHLVLNRSGALARALVAARRGRRPGGDRPAAGAGRPRVGRPASRQCEGRPCIAPASASSSSVTVNGFPR
jgi:uncharacterized RmlC-like cupin family protein